MGLARRPALFLGDEGLCHVCMGMIYTRPLCSKSTRALEY